MKIHYKIISHNLEERNIVVRYYTDLITETELSVSEDKHANGIPVKCRSDVSLSIPIPEPTSAELHKFIIRNSPRQALKNLEIIKMGPIASGIDLSLKNTEKLLNKVFSKTEEEIELMFNKKPTVVANNSANTVVANNSANTVISNNTVITNNAVANT